MKCKFCKAKISKSDEICPECGKYISKKSAATARRREADTEIRSPLGKNIKFFGCESFGYDVFTQIILYTIIVIVAIVGTAKSRFEWVPRARVQDFIVKNAILLSLCLAVIAIGAVIYFTCKKSFICINVFGVYGIKPKLLIIPERFEFFYDDITDFRCRIPAGRGLAVVTVTAKGRVYRIYGLNNKDASYLSTFVRESMPKKNRHSKNR